MSKFSRIILISVISFSFCILGGLTILVNTTDPNHYKNQITQFIQTKTGLNFHIEGRIQWSVFPWFGLKITEAHLENPLGWSDPPFLKAKTFQFHLKVWPLLMKKIEINKLELDEVEINFTQNLAGVMQGLTSQASSRLSIKSDGGEPRLTEKKLNLFIRFIQIKNGTLNWNDNKNKCFFTVSNFNLTAKDIQFDHFFTIDFGGQLHSKQARPLPIQGLVEMQWSQDSGNVAFKNFYFKWGQAELNAHLKGIPLQGNYKVEGALNIRQFNLRDFFKNFNISFPILQNPEALSKISAQIEFSFLRDNIKLIFKKLSLDRAAVNGSINIDRLNTRIIDGHFNIHNLVLDHYLPQFSPPLGEIKTPSETDATSSGEANLFWKNELRKTILNIKLNFTQFKWKNIVMDSLDIPLASNGGLIKIEEAKAKLYKGILNGSLYADFLSDVPHLTVKLKITQIDVNPFLSEAMKLPGFSGVGNLDLELHTGGQTQLALLKNINGEAHFSVLNGQIKQLDIPYQILSRIALFEKKSSLVSDHHMTPFTNLNGSAHILNGVINNNDLSMTTAFFNAQGKGTIDLPTQTINYTLTVRALSGDEVGRYDLPIYLNGYLFYPSIKIGLDKIAPELLTEQAQRLLRSEAQKWFSK